MIEIKFHWLFTFLSFIVSLNKLFQTVLAHLLYRISKSDSQWHIDPIFDIPKLSMEILLLLLKIVLLSQSQLAQII